MRNTVTKSSTVATEPKYLEAISNSASQVFTGRGNLYGFVCENNSGAADVYLQFYDAAAPGDVTVGTNEVFTFRIPISGAFGKDPQEIPLHFFALGCQVAVCDGRSDAVAPDEDATASFWYWNH